VTTFSDIFKKSFIKGFGAGDLDIYTILLAFLATCLLSVFIFFAYRIATQKKFYSKSFNISLALLSIITTSVILTVQSSVVISLGMVGALSIVRFRTAIKDPMDLVFLFWSIGTGITCGAGRADIAVITSVVIVLGIALFDKIPTKKGSVILVVNSSNTDIEDELVSIVGICCKHYKIKSRNITSGQADYIIELRTDNEGSLLKDVNKIEGITSVSLISHDGSAF